MGNNSNILGLAPLFGPGFKDFDKFFVGFDKQFDQLNKLHEDLAKNIPNYPPYNIKKHDDNNYTIELAVAGFGQSDIDIELADGKLVVRGQIAGEDQEDNFLFRGIANRAFTRSFVLNDEVEVKTAEMFNGMLKIFLERLIPEHKQPKKIAVRSKSEKQLLNESANEDKKEKLLAASRKSK
jgi:molecular chaperone IbpA